MLRGKGFSGRSAPYKTTHQRVAVPISYMVNAIAKVYRDTVTKEIHAGTILSSEEQKEPQIAFTLVFKISLSTGEVTYDFGRRFRSQMPTPPLDPSEAQSSSNLATNSKPYREAEVAPLLARYRNRRQDTRNWVEAGRLLDELAKLGF